MMIGLYRPMLIAGFLFGNSFIFSENQHKALASAHRVSWMSPKLKIKRSDHGKSVFAQEKVFKNEAVAVFGGVVLTKQQVLALPQELISCVLQIEDNLWLSSLTNIQATDYINHSCEPNTGFKGQITLVAMRDIEVGEEITFDYAMVVSEWVGMDPITCNCGPSCRKIVLADDWNKKQLQEKYKGYFATYLQDKM